MLEPVYGKQIPDLDRIVSFAQGFPQMAVLLADARLEREPDMGRLTDDELARKMLWGGRDPVERDERVLKGCALFDRFRLDAEVSGEYEFIAKQIVEVNINDFYDCVKRFRDGLINNGDSCKISPKTPSDQACCGVVAEDSTRKANGSYKRRDARRFGGKLLRSDFSP